MLQRIDAAVYNKRLLLADTRRELVEMFLRSIVLIEGSAVTDATGKTHYVIARHLFDGDDVDTTSIATARNSQPTESVYFETTDYTDYLAFVTGELMRHGTIVP